MMVVSVIVPCRNEARYIDAFLESVFAQRLDIARYSLEVLVADGRRCKVTVCVGDRPGALARLAAILASTGASVLDIAHDRHFGPADPALVTISATCETRDVEHIREIEKAMKETGMEFRVER